MGPTQLGPSQQDCQDQLAAREVKGNVESVFIRVKPWKRALESRRWRRHPEALGG